MSPAGEASANISAAADGAVRATSESLLGAGIAWVAVMLLIMGVGRVHLRWIYWLRQIAALSPRSEQDLAQTEQSSRSQLGNTQTREVEEAHPHLPPLVNPSIRVQIDEHVKRAQQKRRVVKLVGTLLSSAIFVQMIAAVWMGLRSHAFGYYGAGCLACFPMLMFVLCDPSMPRLTRVFLDVAVTTTNACVAATVAGVGTIYAMRSDVDPRIQRFDSMMAYLMALWLVLLFCHHLNLYRTLYVTSNPLPDTPRALVREQKQGMGKASSLPVPRAYFLEAAKYYDMPARLACIHLYHAMQVFGLAMGVTTTGFAVYILSHGTLYSDGQQGASVWGSLLPMGVAFLIFYPLGFSHPARQLSSYLLAHVGASSPEARRSVATSLLMGEEEPSVVYERACATFYGVPMRDLTQSLFSETSRPEELHSKRRPLKLGECDGFVSHSWRDNWRDKHEALTRWASEAPRAPGNSDTFVWWDRACILASRSQLPQALSCLPFYIAGCHRLVILAGPTFTQRLWCVMELFIFCEVGPGRGCVDVYRLGRPGNSREFTNLFHAFEVAHAQCGYVQDKEYFVAIIETAFGGHDSFNAIVCNILMERGKD